MFKAVSAGIDFSRQNLTYMDVRLWHLKSEPVLKRFNPLKSEFTIVIFILYKPRIALAIHDL